LETPAEYSVGVFFMWKFLKLRLVHLCQSLFLKAIVLKSITDRALNTLEKTVFVNPEFHSGLLWELPSAILVFYCKSTAYFKVCHTPKKR
jgi:hypothetical protein